MNFFKTEEQKTRKNINKILEICDLQRLKKIEQVLLTGVVQIDSLEVQEKPQIKYQTVSSDEATQETKSTPTKNVEKIMQKSVTLFISKPDTKKNRLAIINAYKKFGVFIKIEASNGKDNFVRPMEKSNADKFNVATKEIEAKLEGYGVRIVAYNRKYNQGGQTL
jgi:hypothetical protein